MQVVDVVSVPAIAAIVFVLIEAFSPVVSSVWKPPVSVVLGIAFAVAAFYLVPDSYENVLAAAFIGVTAGAAASGIDSYRKTYTGTSTNIGDSR